MATLLGFSMDNYMHNILCVNGLDVSRVETNPDKLWHGFFALVIFSSNVTGHFISFDRGGHVIYRFKMKPYFGPYQKTFGLRSPGLIVAPGFCISTSNFIFLIVHLVAFMINDGQNIFTWHSIFPAL